MGIDSRSFKNGVLLTGIVALGLALWVVGTVLSFLPGGLVVEGLLVLAAAFVVSGRGLGRVVVVLALAVPIVTLDAVGTVGHLSWDQLASGIGVLHFLAMPLAIAAASVGVWFGDRRRSRGTPTTSSA